MEETLVSIVAVVPNASSHKAATDEAKRATALRNAVAGALPGAVVELAVAPAWHPLAARRFLLPRVVVRRAIRAAVVHGTIVGGVIPVAECRGGASGQVTAADRRCTTATVNGVTGAAAIRLAPAPARLAIAAVEYAAHGAITGLGTIGRGVLGGPIDKAARCRFIGRIHERTAIAASPELAPRVVAVDQTPASQSDQAEDGPHEERALHWITAAPTCMSAVHLVRKSHPLRLSVNAVMNRGFPVLKSKGATRLVKSS